MLSICGLILGAGIAGCDPSDAGRHAAGLALTCDSEVAHVATLGSLEDPDGVRGNREIYVVPFSASGWVVLEPRETEVLRYDPDGRFEGVLAGREGPLRDEGVACGHPVHRVRVRNEEPPAMTSSLSARATELTATWSFMCLFLGRIARPDT